MQPPRRSPARGAHSRSVTADRAAAGASPRVEAAGFNPRPDHTVQRDMMNRARAVARLLVFGLLVFVALPAKGKWLRGILHDDTVAYVVGHMIDLAAVLAFAAIMAAIEQRPFAAYGLPWRQALGVRFWQGAAVGLVALAVLVFGLQLAG